MSQWALVRDADNVIDNIIQWDGIAVYAPPPGTRLVQVSDEYGVGTVYDHNAESSRPSTYVIDHTP